MAKYRMEMTAKVQCVIEAESPDDAILKMREAIDYDDLSQPGGMQTVIDTYLATAFRTDDDPRIICEMSDTYNTDDYPIPNVDEFLRLWERKHANSCG